MPAKRLPAELYLIQTFYRTNSTIMIDCTKPLTVADLIQIGLLIAAIFTICLTFIQIRKGNKTQKATFFKELYMTLFSDSNIRDAYYKLEYGKFIYDTKFHGSADEKSFDQLLSFIDLICELYYQNVITEKEMNFFKYEITRIFKNTNVTRYLEFLKGFYKYNTDTEPFQSFVKYCHQTIKK
jgi:hypothetical protein